MFKTQQLVFNYCRFKNSLPMARQTSKILRAKFNRLASVNAPFWPSKQITRNNKNKIKYKIKNKKYKNMPKVFR